MGLGLATVVAVEVVVAVIEGLTLRGAEPQGVSGDTLHRLGYPFGTLGSGPLLTLVVAVILVSLPALLRLPTSAGQERAAKVALVLALLSSVALAFGSILAVRYQLHILQAANQHIPSFARVGHVGFLVGALGIATVTIVGAWVGLGMRREPNGLERPPARDADVSPLS
jgi:hypothetical protein